MAMTLALTILSFFPASADAQTYCANFNDGTQSCGIPTLESCQQSISGVGGYCGPDQSAQLPPNLLQRLERRANPNSQPAQPDAPSTQPGGLNWMPPPPGE